MNPLNALTEYLERIERRLRLLAIWRGVAWAAAAALGFTVLGALVTNYFAFSVGSVMGARMVLFLALAGALGAGLLVPLLRLTKRRAAHEAEHKCPQFEQRLVTFAERAERPDPFLELLAADTLDVAREAEPERIAPRRRILSLASAGMAAIALLVWLGVSGPGFLGYGTSLLWGAIPHNQLQPFYEVLVQPGNHTIRRKSDQLVTARLRGFQTGQVRVLAKFQSSSKWEAASMRPEAAASAFEFLFTGVPEAFDYYVEAAGVRSKKYHMNVMDLPEVKKLRVTYHYPAWTALKDAVEDPGGDLRAVEGTEAEIRVVTDRPLSNAALLLDDGAKIELRDGVARVPMQKDGAYHVSTAEQGDQVRLSDDYFIEVRKAMPPNVRIVRPVRDAKPNPIEEVTITVQADDDFALRGMDLHYSVNGGPEKTVALGGTTGKKAEGSTTLYLEDHKLVPGDIVSFYASARDALTTSRTDIFFLEAQPFERQYTQSQQMGGGSGGDQDPRSSDHQKEIIAATWNQIKNPQKDKAAEDENARLLSDVQSKLREQAKSLAGRMQSRDMSATNPAFKSFAEDMTQAVDAMAEAAAKLRAHEWRAALPPEQKSLQYLDRAEATFRDIQVAFGNANGGGQGGAGRDLEGMFDLELDREKNQYETGQNAASSDQRQKAIDEALAKLEELARRQQELADQQRQNQQAYQQRWQQEMLRREAEELRRKLEQLSRSQSTSQGQQGQQGQESRQSQPSGAGQSSGQSSAQSSAMNRALRRLQEAEREMETAGAKQNQGSAQSQAEAHQAAQRLREAREMLAGERKEQGAGQMSNLGRKSQQLAEDQQKFEKGLRQAYGFDGQKNQETLTLQPGTSRQQVAQMAAEQERLLKALSDLEEQMQNAARDMASTQRSASNKLRDALGEMQQEELRLKMKWSLEVIKRGMGEYALTREMPITQGLNQLRDRIREAQNSLDRQQPGGQDIESALARAEHLREQLEQLKNGALKQQQAAGGKQQRSQAGKKGEGPQPGQGQPGQSPGQQPGQGSESGDRSSEAGSAQGGGFSEAFQGGRIGSGGGGPGIDPMNAQRTFREGVRDLTQLDQLLRGNREIPRDVSRGVQDLIRDMQIDPRLLASRPERLDQIIGQLVGGVEQLELELRRLADDQQTGSVRSGPSQPVPPGYADAVAEYFRRLANQK